MKKKEFSSKLQFQKTTIVSFSKMTNIIGGTVQDSDTNIISVDGYTCITDYCGDETRNETCTSCQTSCTRPTTNTRSNTDTVFCGLDSKRECANQ